MDNKFYVSLEAARLLKEKGYNEVVESYYDTLGELNKVHSMFQNSVADNSFLHRFGDYYAAPTKAEAIDWLDSNGIAISIDFCVIDIYEYIVERKSCYHVVESGHKETRLEAEEAAIIKGLELL